MQEKLIRISGTQFSELDKLLSDGWIIKSISACTASRCTDSVQSFCYVHLIKENHENRNTNNS